MSAPVFLVAPRLVSAVVIGDVVVVDGAEGRHAVAVKRLAAGEPVELVDGAGTRLRGEVAATGGRDVLEVRVLAVDLEPVPDPRLVVVQALPKGERGDLAVELLTEVGVDAVVPWAASRCVAQWRGEKAARGVEKWRTTAREAAKQARRARVPEVAALATTADVVGLLRSAALGLVLHEVAAEPLTEVVAGTAGQRGEVVLVVGPEGGIADHELAAFAAAGARAVRLGPTVMRTSTAGVVAAAVVLARSGRWQHAPEGTA